MQVYTGECQCGKTKVTISLPETLAQYSPRACDCDFCVSRNISYLSQPDGTLEIKSIVPLEIQQQGSEQAMFVTCSQCKTVIAASLQLSDKLVGALNSTLLSDFALLQKSTAVSPKKISAQEKVKRWQSLWLNVYVNGKQTVA